MRAKHCVAIIEGGGWGYYYNRRSRTYWMSQDGTPNLKQIDFDSVKWFLLGYLSPNEMAEGFLNLSCGLPWDEPH